MHWNSKVRRTITSLLGGVAFVLAAGPSFAADLTIWGLPAFNPAGDEYLTQLAKEYGASQGIDVEYVVIPSSVLDEKLAAAFAAGAPPDAFMNVGGKGLYYISEGLTAPLDDVLADMRKVEGGIFENVLPQGMYNGSVEALPLEIDVTPMFARTDLLAQVGLDMPETWEDLHAASRAILATDPTIMPFGMALSGGDGESALRQIIWSYGGAMFSEDGQTVTFNSSETIAAYQLLADMVADGTIPRAALSWDSTGNNNAYQTGRSAFIINPPSVYSWMQENDTELLANSALVASPKGPGPDGKSAGLISAWLWMVPKTSTKNDLAKGWLRFFYEPTRYGKLIEIVGGRWVPIYPSMMSLPMFQQPAYSNFGAMASAGIVDGYKGSPSAWASQVNNAGIVTQVMQKIVVDGMSVADAVAWGEGEIVKLKQ